MTYGTNSLPVPFYFSLAKGTVSQLSEFKYRTEIPCAEANLKPSGDYVITLKDWPAKAFSLYYKTIKAFPALSVSRGYHRLYMLFSLKSPPAFFPFLFSSSFPICPSVWSNGENTHRAVLLLLLTVLPRQQEPWLQAGWGSRMVESER